MKLVLLVAILIVFVIWTAAITQLAIAKSKDNDNKKDSSDQPQADESNHLSNELKSGSTADIIPITNEPTAIVKTTVVVPTCADESTDPDCTAKKVISNMPDPTIQKVTPIAKTEDNSLNTISTQDNNIKDNGGQSSGTNSKSNSDSDNELTTQEDKNNFSDKNHDNNLGSESHFVIMQQDRELDSIE